MFQVKLLCHLHILECILKELIQYIYTQARLYKRQNNRFQKSNLHRHTALKLFCFLHHKLLNKHLDLTNHQVLLFNNQVWDQCIQNYNLQLQNHHKLHLLN